MPIRRFRPCFAFRRDLSPSCSPSFPAANPSLGPVGAKRRIRRRREVRPDAKRDYAGLLDLWREFREYQKPRVTAGVPDYTAAAMAAQKARIKEFQDRLAAFDTSGWPVAERVDFEIVRAEMNGLEFDHRVLRPWSRDPTFYAVIENSGPDVPAREGAQVFGCLCLSDYTFPLQGDEAAVVREKLAAIPGLLAQAKTNLTEDARDLYVMGIRQKKDEAAGLERLAKRLVRVESRPRSPGRGGPGRGGRFPGLARAEAPCPQGPVRHRQERSTIGIRNTSISSPTPGTSRPPSSSASSTGRSPISSSRNTGTGTSRPSPCPRPARNSRRR